MTEDKGHIGGPLRDILLVQDTRNGWTWLRDKEVVVGGWYDAHRLSALNPSQMSNMASHDSCLVGRHTEHLKPRSKLAAYLRIRHTNNLRVVCLEEGRNDGGDRTAHSGADHCSGEEVTLVDEMLEMVHPDSDRKESDPRILLKLRVEGNAKSVSC